MKLYIVRHSDKEKGDFYNHELRHQDQPLSDEGKKRAEKLSAYFKEVEIKKVIVSEYVRTWQTAQCIVGDRELLITKDKRLNEIDNGIIESMSDEQIEEEYPEFWNDFLSHSKDVRFPQGETGEEVRNRQNSLLNELISNDEDVLLISHEGYIRLLMCNLLEIPVYKRHKFRVDFCGISEFEYNKDRDEWKVIRFNHTL